MLLSLSVLASSPARSSASMADCCCPHRADQPYVSDTVKSYTFSKACQNFAALLEQARCNGAVRSQRRDGQGFVVMPEAQKTINHLIFLVSG
ncbi:MAG: hypothetical protein J7463_05215 [Roseiflexus sp.]|nr:hypothetical protein [Roseiflexus sp.]MBO9335065.1 hypothetical protein [Roseiflexus sp.]MBO9342347.1 hypothetical protein [Roseiflexus sp.]MBO9364119.1 hypothetical protein [Roseiflexus sp.]MBO9381706.1 hypothetical protein [Roseiflexus sp.]